MRLATFVFALAASAPFSLHAHDGLLAQNNAPAPPDTASVTQNVKMGEGDHQFQSVGGWCETPKDSAGGLLGATHGGIVVDKSGLIYFSTDTARSIMVYSPEGKHLRSFDPKFTKCHGLAIHESNGEQFIYAAHLGANQIVKFKLDGTPVLVIPYPAESGKYTAAGEYKVTGVAVAPNGDIYGADGYGKKWIHRFSPEGKYLSSFGGPDTNLKAPTKELLSNPHGISLDTRSGQPLLLVADREKNRLVHFDLEGKFAGVVVENLRRPCSMSIRGNEVAIAELQGRVTLLDKDNKEVTHLGDNPNKGEWANFKVPTTDWKDGIFTAPHGISYDAAGNLLVMDWNQSGRVSKLKKL
ncbi:MAG TPA: hypothetical protein VK956_15135 [Verrucomicrobium sp.]|nr:hypothetical protein [Verrucomicrobium sp.]